MSIDHLDATATAVAVTHTCPVCGTDADRHGSAPGWGHWLRCPSCTHEFVSPLERPESPHELFSAAYAGEESRSGMSDFAERVAQRDAIVVEPGLWFWTPAFEQVLEWLKAGRRRSVLELGCGLGFFLHALRRAGIEASGLDVADTAVELNRRDGFPVWHGTLSTLPDDWCTPDAVVVFFVLHHVPDPVGMLRELRERWPSAPVAVAFYGPAGFDPDRDTPPRTLHKWNTRAVVRAFSAAGYRVEVREIPATGIDGSRVLAHAGIQRRLQGHPGLYRFARRLAFGILRRLPKRQERQDHVLLALAEPRPAGGDSR